MTKSSPATKAVYLAHLAACCGGKPRQGRGGDNPDEVMLPHAAAGFICFSFSACFLRPAGTLREAFSQQWFLFPDDSILHLDDKTLASTEGFM